MAGLDPAIHVFFRACSQDGKPGVEPGHDVSRRYPASGFSVTFGQ